MWDFSAIGVYAQDLGFISMDISRWMVKDGDVRYALIVELIK